MKNYKKMTHEELLGYVEELQNRKKYGLVWEDKPEDVVEQCKEMLPVLEEVSDRAIEKDENSVTNLLIEGDNYHALSVLNYTHAGKIDVIYIDPPYNTGKKDFKYNDVWVDESDTYRHSKWLSFMEKRLKLAKTLLKKDGAIFISIDDHEQAPLKMLCDEIFGEDNFIDSIVWDKKSSAKGVPPKNMMVNVHEYIIAYQKSDCFKFVGHERTEESGKFKNPDNDPRGSWRESNIKSTTKPIDQAFTIVDPNTGKEYTNTWAFSKESLKRMIKEKRILWKDTLPKQKEFMNEMRNENMAIRSNWGVFDAQSTTVFLKGLLPDTKFDNPKPIRLMEYLIKVATRKDATILDFFAGSGTTAHAILKINAEDSGNRRFILCTNNENNNGNGNVGIAEGVTYPRVKNVIDGYADVEGIPANLRYFKTAFVKQTTVSDDTRRELVKKSTEMICVKESTYKKVYDNKKYKVYKNNEHITGILFDLDSIKEFKEKIDGSGIPAHLYIFSLSNDTFSDDFSSLEVEHTLCPIPESILEVYRKLFA